MQPILQFALDFRFFYLPLFAVALVASLLVGVVIESFRQAREEERRNKQLRQTRYLNYPGY
jgi:hypothetical protein